MKEPMPGTLDKNNDEKDGGKSGVAGRARYADTGPRQMTGEISDDANAARSLQSLCIHPKTESAAYCKPATSISSHCEHPLEVSKTVWKIESALQSMPNTFTVETILGCDLSCPECALGGGFITREKGWMRFERFKQIADKIQPYCEYLYLHIWGEPLLNPDIYKIIKYASNFTRTNISTNCQQVDEQVAQNLIRSNVTDIIASIDGVSQDVYETYRAGGSVEKAITGLRLLQETKIRTGSNVNIMPQFIVFKHNQHEMSLFSDVCRTLGLRPAFKAPYLRNQNSRLCLSDMPQFVRPCFKEVNELRAAMQACPNAKGVFTILLDGTVTICCHDHGNQIGFGNVFERSVEEIWCAPEYKAARNDILTGKAPPFCIENCMTWFLNNRGDMNLEEKNNRSGRSDSNFSINESPYVATGANPLSAGACREKAAKMFCQKSVKRRKPKEITGNFTFDIDRARGCFKNANYSEAFDIFEQLYAAFPERATSMLAEAYRCFCDLPHKDRYRLYQARIFDFNIQPGNKVLDVGSGHIPFPLATHLADISLTDDNYGRASVPFKHIEGKPVYECNVENLPFQDKEFDFIYCSHVLEHVNHPESACEEIMRVAKRGYIETPAKGKDIFLNTIKVSNHRFWVENVCGKLFFTEYSPEEVEGLQSDLLMSMHTAPQSEREMAFSALIYLKPQLFNTMFFFDDRFENEVRRNTFTAPVDSTLTCPSPARHQPENNDCSIRTQVISGSVDEQAIRLNHSLRRSGPVQEQNERCPHPRPVSRSAGTANSPARRVPDASGHGLKFLQIHTFYRPVIENLYKHQPHLKSASFKEQTNGLVRDGFSAVHMFAPYMRAHAYETELVIANNPYAQYQWIRENGLNQDSNDESLYGIPVQQVDLIKPDILYISDPVTFDSRFISALSWKPRLVIGWRAANVPETTDWSKFDVVMSSLAGMRELALRLGAGNVEHFYPGYPVWINDWLSDTTPLYDVVFSGSWTVSQHPRRNEYIKAIADAVLYGEKQFDCAFYINADANALPEAVAKFNLGPRFGVDMHRALRSGKIVIDGRGVLELTKQSPNGNLDIAGKETANMRLFEATGSGCFLLTEYHDNLKDYFEPGVEIETYRDKTELIDKIGYYLDNPAKRKEIARRGQQKCLSEYAMDKRAAAMDSVIRKYLSPSQPPIHATQNEISALMQAVEKLIKEENFSAAFDLTIKAKARKEPMLGLDYLRAVCFIGMKSPVNALEALREELRLFPQNEKAQVLFERLSKEETRHFPASDDPEINQVIDIVKPYTQLSPQRLISLFNLAKLACDRDMPGNFVECGVAAGGSAALLAYVIKKYSRRYRKLYAFDSFEGMPSPTPEDKHSGVPADQTGWGTGTCYATESSVRSICQMLDVLDGVELVKGYFQDTLPEKRDQIGSIALLHMDGDWYESTKAILNNLYDHVITGGIFQVDDYGHWEGCKKAVQEFEGLRKLSFNISPIDNTGVWFSKPD